MKIAVTYENGSVFGHFGHTEQFKIYQVEDGAVVKAQVVPTNGSGHGALAGVLADHGVDCLNCGGPRRGAPPPRRPRARRPGGSGPGGHPAVRRLHRQRR